MTVAECIIAFVIAPLFAFASTLLIGMRHNREMQHIRETCFACNRKVVIREILDGDKLCQLCCNKWVRGEGASMSHGEKQ